ncbi:MAG: prepilin-type N-terminal cleavage/methylation domain-containing protein [Candidatus Gracilibacteria bacterium]|nr:prepilin-type N-terminal cleavage/methylation domain-containing protein [Candidatus Gracilibacteria bacterium]
MYKKNAFSLIEVLVATSILSIAVFGVYKMIGENNKIITNSNNYLNKTLFFPIIETCIEKSGITNGFNYIDIGNDYTKCDISSSIIINKIDNIDYILIADLKDDLTYNRVWNTIIKDDFSGTSSGIYIQKK